MFEKNPFIKSGAERFLDDFETNLSCEEIKSILDEIEEIIRKLVESGSNLAPIFKKIIILYLQTLLQDLGLNGVGELATIYKYLSPKHQIEMVSKNFPSFSVFSERVDFLQRNDSLNDTSVENIETASQASQFAKVDKNLKGRSGQPQALYLYNLAKVMSNRYLYDITILASDHIKINSQGEVQNGLHRVFALKALGPEFVYSLGMDEWVKIQTEN